MKSRFLAIALATVMFVSIHPIANAGVVKVQGYSCDNLTNVEEDIKYLANELPRLRRNSIVKNQVALELHRLRAEKEMLQLICKTDDEDSFIIIIEDNSQEY